MFNLPKWPQMRVIGKTVTIDQAKDIIFKTDRFLTDSSEYAGGNNREFNKMYREVSGLDTLDQKDWDAGREVRQKVGTLSLNYCENNWTSCCFIYGAHGWCHPNGKIFYQDNVGKYPESDELIADWTVIAEAFPFLDLDVIFMSGESCEEDTFFIFGIRVVDGKATVYDTENKVATQKWNDTMTGLAERHFMGREQGLPDSWVFNEFAPVVKSAVQEYLAEQKAVTA